MWTMIGVLAATPSPLANPEGYSPTDPILVLCWGCAIAGVILLGLDGVSRVIAAQGDVVVNAVAKTTDALAKLEMERDPNGTLSAEQKEMAEKAAQATRDKILETYSKLFNQYPHLIVGATLLIVPLIILGKFSLGIS